MRAGWGLGVMLLVGPAFGKTPEELFDQGLRQLQGGDVGGARSSFMEAFTLSRQPRIALQLSIAELRSNRPLEGLRHLKEYVKDPRVSASERERAKVYLDEAMGRTGHVRIDVPAGTEISVDSTRIGAAPLAEDVDVEADKDVDVAAVLGAVTKHQAIHVPAGRTVTLKFEGLTGQGAAQTRPSGTAAPDSASFTSLPPKSAVAGGWPTAKIVTVATLGGLGAAGLVVSGVFYAKARSAEDDAVVLSNKNGPEYSAQRESYDSARTLSTIFFYGGAVLAVGAAVSAAFWPSSRATSTSLRFAPGALTLTGAF